MFNILIKLLASKLHNLFLLVALTGFVCTYKIQAEEQCLSSNILCYECDSRYDADCGDPFDLPSVSLAEQQTQAAQAGNKTPAIANNNGQAKQQTTISANSYSSASNGTQLMRPMKNMSHHAVCHGCCVKMTSLTPEGAVYVKRTCTTNLQINYFMVGLICMKESYDRGKMCFCETDYCNGVPYKTRPANGLVLCLLIVAMIVSTTKLGR